MMESLDLKLYKRIFLGYQIICLVGDCRNKCFQFHIWLEIQLTLYLIGSKARLQSLISTFKYNLMYYSLRVLSLEGLQFLSLKKWKELTSNS